MALIKCPECGQEISDTVKNCPHCGYKIKELDKRKILTLGIAILFVVVIIFMVKKLSGGVPKELSLTLEMTKDDVHKKIGNNFETDKDDMDRDIEIYDLKWCGYNGKLSVTYTSDSDTILSWIWEIDTSNMNNEDIEDAMNKVKEKITTKYGKPEESNVSRLQYEWVTTHRVKGKTTFDVGYVLIRDNTLRLDYGEVY
jgi:hypothetical protein